MLARKCDRCGSFYDHYNKTIDKRIPHVNRVMFSSSTETDYQVSTIKYVDLCPSCMKATIKFIFMEDDDTEESEDVE